MAAPDFDPRQYWQDTLSRNFDLRGTGHPGLSEAYNDRCYRLRRFVLEDALRRHRIPVAGHEALDAGCGSGFFVQLWLSKGAHVTGVDLTDVAVEKLSRRFPLAQFEVGDLASWRPSRQYDVVSCFDVLFHIVDDASWERALSNLADAVAPGGWFVFTEHFFRKPPPGDAVHNKSRGRSAYETALIARGLAVMDERPTHHLMNRELGFFRFLNRFPELIYRVDLFLLMTRLLEGDGGNRLVLARRPIVGEVFRP